MNAATATAARFTPSTVVAACASIVMTASSVHMPVALSTRMTDGTVIPNWSWDYTAIELTRRALPGGRGRVTIKLILKSYGGRIPSEVRTEVRDFDTFTQADAVFAAQTRRWWAACPERMYGTAA